MPASEVGRACSPRWCFNDYFRSSLIGFTHSHSLLDYLGVYASDPVDSVGAHHTQMGHVDPLGVPLLDQGHPPQAVDVSWEHGGDPLTGDKRSMTGQISAHEESPKSVLMLVL